MQLVVDALRERLGITAVVTVTMVEHDDRRRVGPSRSAGPHGTFALSVERGFVEGLPAAQLEAALAHELGHVWIYTHHPYLQTEQLANRVAMRAVARERLVAVYSTLWGADALHGSLEAFSASRRPRSRARARQQRRYFSSLIRMLRNST